MYRHLRQRPGNLFFSPFSIRTVLGMTLAGARGDTATQMKDALRVSSSVETLHADFAKIIQRLNAGGGPYEMAVANSLWCQEGAPLRPEFLDRVARHYGGGVDVLDFVHAAEAARQTINRWVEEMTRQRIGELIPSGGVGTLTRLVLVNAVYFKGMWVLPFDRENTREEPFRLESGGTVQAPLMRQQGDVGYLQADGFQAVELLYRGRDLSMVVLLPDRKDGLAGLEETLTPRMLDLCVTRMDRREVDLSLPRFKVTWAFDARNQLAELGMPVAFTPGQADLSGINGVEPPAEESLFISSVFHKAFVESNEEGTEAAAATAEAVEMMMALNPSKPPPVPVFRADHPFLFAILDRATGAILFLGRICDPTREN